jgi:hypothetical protein
VVIGLDHDGHRAVIIPKMCGRWDCPQCGDFKARAYAARIFAAAPERHVTLTCNPARYRTHLEAFLDIKDKVRKLAHLLRSPDCDNQGLPLWQPRIFEYACVWDTHESGWPHAHLATWGDFIPQALLSTLWERLTGAFRVDIRALHDNERHRHNFVKYIASKFVIPYGAPKNTRRITFSGNYDRNPRPPQANGPISNCAWFWLSCNPFIFLEWLETTNGAKQLNPGDTVTLIYDVDTSLLNIDIPYLKDLLRNFEARFHHKANTPPVVEAPPPTPPPR